MKPKIALVRGNGLAKFELQYYEPLIEKFDITAVCSLTNPFDLDNVKLPIKRLLSVYDFEILFPRFLKMRKIYQRIFYYELFLQKIFNLEKFLRDFDIIHSSDVEYYYTYQCAKVKLKYNKKFVFTQWQNIPFAYGFQNYKFVKAKRFKLIKDAVDIVIAKSERAKLTLIIEGFDENKIVVIKPGIDIERFKPAPKNEKLMSKFKISESDKVILFSGRLQWQKGIIVLLNAFKLLMKDKEINRDRVKLLIVGTGQLYHWLNRYVRFLEIKDNVIFAGGVKYDEMPGYHNLADVFVLPSVPDKRWQEQFGMVLIEAMACGKPVITTLSGSIPEVVGDKAILVQPFDFYELYKALKKVLTDEHLARELGEKSREFVIQNYNAKDVAKKIENVYNSLL